MKTGLFIAICLASMLIKAQDPPTTEDTAAADGPFEDEQSTTFVPPENSAREQELCSIEKAELNPAFYEEYYEFLKSHGKAYTCEDFVTRYALYAQRREEIDRFNSRGDVSYVQGANYFTDLTDAERLARYLGVQEKNPDSYREHLSDTGSDDEIEADAENVAQEAELNGFTANVLDLEIFRSAVINFDFLCCRVNPFGVPCKKDWQELGKVTSVKSQGCCGSCWAFAAVAAAESAYLINYGSYLNLSEQELISCATGTYGNFGCNGGWPHKALDYIIQNRINRETNFPYNGNNSLCVPLKPNLYKYPIKSRAIVLPQNRMDKFLQALNKQPIAVAFKVTGSFFNYKSGIYNPANDAECSTPGVNQAVLAVGYSLGCAPYIRFKNSWGELWGEKGYFRMKLSKNIFQNGGCNLINHPYNVYPGL